MDKEPGEGGLFMEQRGGVKALRLGLVVSHDLAEKEALMKIFWDQEVEEWEPLLSSCFEYSL